MAKVTKNKNDKIARIILYIFLTVAVFLMFIMLKNIITPIYGNINSIHWISVDAKLLNASIKTTTTSRSSSNTTVYIYYGPQITYQYDFDGTNCVGRRVWWVESTDNGPLEQLAYKFKSYYKAGKPIQVFVNPDKPCEAVADRSVHWSKLTTSVVMLLVLLLFGGGIMYLLLKMRKKW
ncbi:DUF3592 domain-containing protein [Alteromonas sp. 1_MG-2023]|uniref:DUF3592 domain-containing protein n=1 Tax=Alteromonas sp. 1_MG-2023 TaxID=3062669 RepID=UPI0026E2040D|nr:DUF3592 domain-containing protein [Alteromonas sp. 1_MG-2023]MDO6568710.1 DUF3592 domain-containing protein [Alteromonas sp. 1_MG-2023]